METTRTTIRLRKDLLDQSRMTALHKHTSIQNVINDTLAIGFSRVTDLNIAQDSIEQIDKFRNSLKDRDVNLEKLLTISKHDLA